MYTWKILVAVNGNRGLTQWVQLQADNGYSAKMLAESMYGSGNVITYSQLTF
jgi:hypothetical protein